MPRLILVVVVGLVSSLAAVGLYRLDARMAEIEQKPTASPRDVESLRGELARIEDQIAGAVDELQALRSTGQYAQQLDTRLARVETDLGQAADSLREHQSQIEAWEEFREQAGPRALDERMESFAREAAEHWKHVDEVAQTAMGLAEATSANLDMVRHNLARDTDRMWRDLVGPTVQLTGENTVGSGVLLESDLAQAPDQYRTYLITAWHVVRDIQAGEENTGKPVPVTVYGQDGRIWHETASLLQFNPAIDAAILQLDTTRKVECGAKLARRDRIERARIFDQVYAVGCPLGNDPIPTFGEVADTRHVIDGEHYWMISAPTYIGNSGGGIFDAENHKLLGIFSKIYTHGTLRPTVVPHMGLATPMSAIYDWLATVGLAQIVPPTGPASEDAVASASHEPAEH